MEFNLVSVVLAASIVSVHVATAQEQLCPASFGDYNDGGSCVTFVRCQNGVAYRLGCPRAQPFFDREARRCTNQQQLNCLQNNQVAGPLLAGRAGAAAIGQLQQPAINQVQIAGAPGFGQLGTLPNGGGLLVQRPNAGAAPFAPANPAVPWRNAGGRGRGTPTVAGIPGVGGGSGAAVAAGAAVGAGGGGANAGVLAGAANQAGAGNQPPVVPPLHPAAVPAPLPRPAAGNAFLPRNPAFVPAGNPAFVPAGNPAFAPAGNPAFVPAGNPAFAPAGNPAFVPAGNPAFVPAGNPNVFPARPVGFASGQQLGNPGNFGNGRGGFLIVPGHQGQGQISARAAAGGGASAVAAAAVGNGANNGNRGRDQGRAQGQGQAQGEPVGLAGIVPLVIANQRQSATINQDQTVGVNPAGGR